MKTDYNWILGIIHSCTNGFHLDCAERLLSLFGDKYGIDGEDEYNLLIQALVDKKTFLTVEV